MNDSLFALIRFHYRAAQGYVSAGMEEVKDPDKIFMNANENPYELPGLEGFSRYPEPQPKALLKSYAALYGVTENNIVMTRGADEAIMILTKLFCEPGQDAILIHPPTFGIYSVDAKAMPADVVEVPLIKENGTYKLDTHSMIEAAKNKSVKLVHICSPNNPTGTSFPHAEILTICKETKNHAVIALDETYAEFSKQGSLTGELKNHPNLIILRTLSKSYAMAGMRMGSLLCGDEDFIALVRSKCLDAYPLPVASVNAALRVTGPNIQKIAQANIQKLLAEKDRLAARFKQSPAVTRVYPSDTNFFFVEMKDAHGFWTFCKQNNIILRDFSNKKLTENCLRISPGLPEENDKLMKLLEQFES
ncbi:MAG: histidinol-phosphate transaminase [Alphaproteobacteria bacterium]